MKNKNSTTNKLSILALIFLLSFVYCGSIFGQDTAGSKDHPLITRYPGSEIGYYEVQKYQKYHIATGPETGYKQIDKWVEAEGKFTRIYYIIKGETTLTEVYQNYKTALSKAGFKTLAEGSNPTSGVSKEIGGRGFLNTLHKILIPLMQVSKLIPAPPLQQVHFTLLRNWKKREAMFM